MVVGWSHNDAVAAGFAEKANQSTDSKITSNFAVVPVRLAAIQVRVAFCTFFSKGEVARFSQFKGGLGSVGQKYGYPLHPLLIYFDFVNFYKNGRRLGSAQRRENLWTETYHPQARPPIWTETAAWSHSVWTETEKKTLPERRDNCPNKNISLEQEKTPAHTPVRCNQKIWKLRS